MRLLREPPVVSEKVCERGAQTPLTRAQAPGYATGSTLARASIHGYDASSIIEPPNDSKSCLTRTKIVL